MTILVTGGAGFIGSNLVDFLVSNGKEVIVVDDLSTGKLDNLLSSLDEITFVESKIEDFDFSSFPSINSVIHLSAQVSVPLSITKFKESSSSNILGSICVINFCSLNKVPLVYASSSALYGDLSFGDDSIPDIDLHSPYAADKHCMELYSKVAHKLHNLPSIGLRFFNVYGPRQDPSSPYSGVISVFVDNLIKQQPITINGGHQTRDFIYVNDVVMSIYRAYLVVNESNICEQINVLTGNSTSVESLATMVMESFNWNVKKIYQSIKPGDIEFSVGSTEKMTKLLGIDLNNFTKIDKGLKNTIKLVKKNIT